VAGATARLNLDVQAYLSRIGYHGPRDPSGATLRGLHRQHLFTVPFENLDIALGVPIQLDPGALFDKVAVRRRGGFCYELNGLFYELLVTLGFRVEMLSARVRQEDGGFSPEFDHLLLKVSLPDEWIADVGFGESFIHPLPMPPAGKRSDDDPDFAVLPADSAWDLVRRRGDGVFVPLYRFTKAPRKLVDFASRSRFHQTSPASHFTRRCLCSKALPDGRVTVSGMRLIITRSGVRRESQLRDREELCNCLREHFGIELPDETDWSKLAG
jgi:N-hydroxyarylamine O-acetyltransferase